MRISVLAENHAGSFTLAEHGLSYFIEHDGKRILFDTGQSDIFLRNAKLMNISMEDIDVVVLSHGHYDHGNGLDYLRGKPLICHPDCFVKRYSRKGTRYIGLKSTRDELEKAFSLTTSAEPVKISEKIIFLGEIPRLGNFESQSTSFMFEDGSPDYVTDDSALALILDEGLFVITGCGHAGIVNTLEHAMKVTGINEIHGIMGGFHLKEIDNQTLETIAYLKKNRIKHILPSHCTELPALSAFYESFRIRQIKTGDLMNF